MNVNNQAPIQQWTTSGVSQEKAFPAFPEKTFATFLSYVSENNPTVDTKEAIARIKNGKAIADQLIGSNPHAPENRKLQPTKDNCRDLCWYLTAQAYRQEGVAFSRGVIRVMNGHENTPGDSHALYNFLSKCTDSYDRPSSHFNEKTIGKQRGMNFDEGELHDTELKTMLCGKLNDGSFFIKFETEGFDWKNDPIGAIAHAANYLKHVAAGGGEKVVKGRATRRETDNQETVNTVYQQVIDVIKADKDIKKNVGKKHLKEMENIHGTADRYSEVEWIKQHVASLNPAFNQSIRRFENVVENIKNYKVISGNEVLLTL